jgi:hypothetical protein
MQTLLAGCGSGSSTTATASPSSSTETTASRQAPPQITAAQRHRAGGAAPFLKAGYDNSIPTFGTESSADNLEQAETVVRTFLTARASGDWARACQQLVAVNVKHLAKLGKPGKETCPQVLSALTSDTANPLAGPLSALRVKGKNAFALFVGGEGQQFVVPLQREDGQWRMTQTTPILYPPEAPRAN